MRVTAKDLTLAGFRMSKACVQLFEGLFPNGCMVRKRTLERVAQAQCEKAFTNIILILVDEADAQAAERKAKKAGGVE